MRVIFESPPVVSARRLPDGTQGPQGLVRYRLVYYAVGERIPEGPAGPAARPLSYWRKRLKADEPLTFMALHTGVPAAVIPMSLTDALPGDPNIGLEWIWTKGGL
jgi:hypothetical protein